MNYQYFASPIGRLRLVSNGTHLLRIEFEGQYVKGPGEQATTDAVLDAASDQLTAYFGGRRQSFSLPTAAHGTVFQQTVWQALQDIPFGQVRSYRDIACALGNAAAVRAVGAANGRNPLPIIVPCHRVIGSNGSLTGFAGGLSAKKILLQLEGALQGDGAW